MKFRILQVEDTYISQQRFLFFFWHSFAFCGSLDSAKKQIDEWMPKKIPPSKKKKIVIYDIK